MERDCNNCIWSSRDGNCSSWECEFVDKREAYNAWKKARWIPVEEKLPEFGGTIRSLGERKSSDLVMVTIGNCVRLGRYTKCRGWVVTNAPFALDETVTAWQPLPEPYEGEK